MDRFECLEKLGEGPAGTVFKARDRELGELVALRVIEEAEATRAEALLQVARRAAAIRDPRVVTVRGCGAADGKVWVAMELVPGRTLARALAEDGPFAAARLVELGCALCAALEAGHRGDLVHRDLKPSSVMLLPDGGIKVMDFGLTHALERLGTAPYVSPEAARGWRVDPRSDLYSLGVLLIELATGDDHRDDDGPIALPSEVPAALTAVLLRMIHKDAGARFRSAAAAAEALRRCADPAPARSLRRPAIIGIGAALVVAGGIGLALLLRGGR